MSDMKDFERFIEERDKEQGEREYNENASRMATSGELLELKLWSNWNSQTRSFNLNQAA